VLDLPAARHLLDDQLGVHADLDAGGGVQVEDGLQPGHQPAVLGHVVGGPAYRGGALGEHPSRVGVAHQRAVAGRPGVAPRSAVGLDDQPPTHLACPPVGEIGVLARFAW
jgi:hypothetical protein